MTTRSLPITESTSRHLTCFEQSADSVLKLTNLDCLFQFLSQDITTTIFICALSCLIKMFRGLVKIKIRVLATLNNHRG